MTVISMPSLPKTGKRSDKAILCDHCDKCFRSTEVHGFVTSCT